MSQRSPAFQFYPGEYLASERVALMSFEEEGAYVRALAYSWLNDGIPKDPQRLALVLGKGCSLELAQKTAAMFIASPDNPERMVNPRQEQEREKQKKWRALSEQGNQSRWQSPAKPAPTPKPYTPRDQAQPPPKDAITKINSDYSAVIERLRSGLSRIFDRADGETWSYYEDTGLAAICTRPKVLDELAMIRKYRDGIAQHDLRFMFPTTLSKLLDDWTGTLDKARSNGPKTPKKADPNIFTYGAAKFTKDARPKREQFNDDNSFVACVEMYDKWLASRSSTPAPA